MLDPPVPATVADENAAETPAGKPAAERLTAEVKAFCGLTDTDSWPVPPARAVTDAALVERANVGAAETIRGIASVVLKPLPLAATVRL